MKPQRPTPFTVWPVLPTPFQDDGAVDRDGFAAVVDFAREAGVDGLVFPGVASEVDMLTEAERSLLVGHLGRRLAGALPFIVGASHADPATASLLAETGRDAGAVAAMVRAPASAGREAAGQIAYFRAVAKGTRLPLMLQNVPGPVGAGLSPALVGGIARAVPGIRSVKEETLPCGQNVTGVLDAAGDAVDAVYGGAGARYVLEEIARGAAGTMPALELADIHAALARAANAGEAAESRRLFRDSLPFLNLQAVFRWHATKWALRRRGIIRGLRVRAPGPAPDAEDRREMDRMLAELADRFTLHAPPRYVIA